MRPLVARIDLAALKSNFLLAQLAAPESKNFAVIKADAYGHGAIACAKALDDHADGFAVATIEEAVELRSAKFDKPILILSSFCQADEIEILANYQLMPVIHSLYQLDLFKQNSKLKEQINCWLKIDTGMNRLGLSDQQFVKAQEKIKDCDLINVVGVMSHFASSDETRNDLTQQQINKFNMLTDMLSLPVSLANSSAIMAWPHSHKDWNRPGIMLYGTSTIDHNADSNINLKPVMHLDSKLIAIKSLKKGDSVGYGQTFVADKAMKIGVVACGYADGYPRNAATGSPIIVCGQRTKILGRVSMDTMSVDLNDISQAQVGDPVVLWGNDLLVREVADAANTIPYELLTHVSKRVPRLYSIGVNQH